MGIEVNATEQIIEVNATGSTIDINVSSQTVDVNATTSVIEVTASYNPGINLPNGGTTGQVLKKFSNTDYDTYWATDASGLTSVGLSMPSGFVVSNSPLTTNGTLSVTGAGNSLQYLDGTGNLQTFPLTFPVLQEVRNQTGATITAGTVVYINGATGNKPTIAKAIATGDPTSAQTLGMVQSNISNNGTGYVIVIGTCTNLDTSAYSEGQQLYLSGSVAGGVTTTKPYAPTHLVYVGIVTRSHPTLGTIEVRVQNGYEMDELHDVSAQTPSNNDGLFYNTSTSLWESKSIATALGYTPGTVSSVALSVPTGLVITSGSPITTSGTIAVGLQSGYSIPTTVKQGNWDDAYTFVSAFPSQTGNSGKYLTTDGSTLSWGTVSTANIYNSDGTLTGNRTVTSGGFGLTFTGSNTAASAIARGLNLTHTLIAAANNDTLVGLDINPTFTNGAFTGVKNYVARLGNHIGVSTLSAFTLNYIYFESITANQGISAVFRPNGTPTGYGYNFQFNKSSTANSNDLLIIGGGSSASGNAINKHVISTSCDGTATAQPLVLRVAPTSTNWGSVNDHLTLFSTGNVVIQSVNNSATDAGYKLDVNGTGRFTGNTTINGNLYLANTSNIVAGAAGDGLYLQGQTRTYFYTSTSTYFARGYNGSLLIGTTAQSNDPVASAVLQADSTTQGFLLPRMTGTQVEAISTPATGLMAYATAAGSGAVTSTGWWGYDGSAWTKINGGGGAGMAIGGSITSATAGSVLFAGTSGVLQQDNSNFFWDDSNNRLGIGTNAPNNLIHIVKNQNAVTSIIVDNRTAGTGSAAVIEINSDGQNAVNLGKFSSLTTTYKTIVANDGYLANFFNGDLSILNDYASGKIKFAAGGSSTAQATLFSTGNFIIGGTTDAGYKLDVQGTLRVTGEGLIQGLTVGTGNSSPLTNANTSFGYRAGAANTSTAGVYGNTSIGYDAGRLVSTGYSNTLVGYYAGTTLTTGVNNTVVGNNAMYSVPNNSNDNTSIGLASLGQITGSSNTAIGKNAGRWRASNNTDLGTDAGGNSVATGSNNVSIGYSSGKYAGDNKLYIASTPASYGNLIYGDFSTGQLKINDTNTPSLTASAQLEVVSTTRGFLPPRMTETQKNAISTPATGLVIYQTDGTEGLYQYKSTGWSQVAGTGGGGGISRSVNVISTTTTAGASASTDYVYLISGTTTLTLPTAVGNTNRYTLKNVGTNTVTINTTSSQTIDGSTSITMAVRYTALDVISDGTNWNII